MDGIKNISSNNHNNHNNYYNGDDEQSNLEDQDKQTFDLAQVLKTGYQKESFRIPVLLVGCKHGEFLTYKN